MVNYKVTYYHDTCSAWVDKDPTIKHFEFEFEMSDWIDEEMERRVNETIENSFPEDLYICYKTPTRIKANKPAEETEETEKSDEVTE